MAEKQKEDSESDDENVSLFQVLQMMGLGNAQNPAQGGSNDALINLLRQRKISQNERVFTSLRVIPRGLFFPADMLKLAYLDAPQRLPSFGFNISAPHMYGICLDGLNIQEGDNVLDIGSGCGHFTALAGYLAGKSGSALGVDLRKDIILFAEENVKKTREQGVDVGNVSFEVRNCFLPISRKFDKIHSGACCPVSWKDTLLSLLKPNGILVTPYEDYLHKFVKDSSGNVTLHKLMKVRYSDLIVPSEPEMKEAKKALEREEAINIVVPKSTFFSDISNLFNDPKISDVAFLVQGQKFYCHRVILAARSPFFLTMFSSGMQESQKKVIEFPNLDPEPVKICFEEIYGKESAIFSPDQAIEILGPSTFFQLERLRLSCESVIRHNLEIETACYVLQIADQFNCEGLKNFTLDFIVSNYDAIEKTDSYANLEKRLLVMVTKAAITFSK